MKARFDKKIRLMIIQRSFCMAVLDLMTFMIFSVLSLSLHAATIEEKLKIAQRFYAGPARKWTILEQPFWKQHIVFKLTHTEDPRWYHRPAIAVDDELNGYMLTDNVIRDSQEKILDNFNQVAKKESARIAADNAQQYALFFTKVHFLSDDSLYIVSQNIAEKIYKIPKRSEQAELLKAEIANRIEPEITIRAGSKQFHATAFLWHSKTGVVAQHQFTIQADGTVYLGKTEFCQQPES